MVGRVHTTGFPFSLGNRVVPRTHFHSGDMFAFSHTGQDLDKSTFEAADLVRPNIATGHALRGTYKRLLLVSFILSHRCVCARAASHPIGRVALYFAKIFRPAKHPFARIGAQKRSVCMHVHAVNAGANART